MRPCVRASVCPCLCWCVREPMRLFSSVFSVSGWAQSPNREVVGAGNRANWKGSAATSPYASVARDAVTPVCRKGGSDSRQPSLSLIPSCHNFVNGDGQPLHFFLNRGPCKVHAATNIDGCSHLHRQDFRHPRSIVDAGTRCRQRGAYCTASVGSLLLVSEPSATARDRPWISLTGEHTSGMAYTKLPRGAVEPADSPIVVVVKWTIAQWFRKLNCAWKIK